MRKKIRIHNPYTGDLLAVFDAHSEQQVKKLISSSFKYQNRLSIEEKRRILLNSAKELHKRRSELSRLITSESGLCLKDTGNEVKRTVSVIREAVQLANNIDAISLAEFSEYSDSKLKIIAEPFNLILAVTPFNHPINQIAHKICPAIAVGSKILVKPSEKTLLSAMALLEIFYDNGLKKEAVRPIIIPKEEKIFEKLISSPFIQVIAFTGSFKTGKLMNKLLLRNNRWNVKQIYELGGSSPLVVADDADIKTAVNVALSVFQHSGQRCTTIRKIFVCESIFSEFLEKFISVTGKLRVGNPLNKNTDVGTLIDQEAAKRVEGKVKKAISEGAKLVFGGKRDGAQYHPTILTDVNPNSNLIKEETFGPVAPILKIKTIDEAIRITLKHDYLLAGAIVTKSKKKAIHLSENIGVGQFNWNAPPSYRKEFAPFGGFGKSGNGIKEGVILLGKQYMKIRTFYSQGRQGI
ncbi:MAG: aldehyde dehydrogenase family protein [archaeon]